MLSNVIQSSYPLSFRAQDAKRLGQLLKDRRLVVLIGMRKVGISNFLRFFINHQGVIEKYLTPASSEQHLFIQVDLNDLVEREIYPFWVLTFKRVVDSCLVSPLVNEVTKKELEKMFLDGIQSENLFLLMDGVRRSLLKLVGQNILPTLFFNRFDRIKDTATSEFFANLKGLHDASDHRVAFVFTSFKPLEKLFVNIPQSTFLLFNAQDLYLKPVTRQDLEVIFEADKSLYRLNLSLELKQKLFELANGYIQYLELALIMLYQEGISIETPKRLEDLLKKDERINLQSEEIWDSLNDEEHEVLGKVILGITESSIPPTGRYLIESGMLFKDGNEKMKIFSPLFEHFVKHKFSGKNHLETPELTKKEHLLLKLLQGSAGEIVERETIIECVWPEEEALGVSDWAIDKLVGRLRSKLKDQNSLSEIVTVKTRGYKIIS